MAEGTECDTRKKMVRELIEREQELVLDLTDCQKACSQANEMSLLHKYNEIKDATQVLLGAIANIECVTVKELHERFQLPIND